MEKNFRIEINNIKDYQKNFIDPMTISIHDDDNSDNASLKTDPMTEFEAMNEYEDNLNEKIDNNDNQQ